MSPRFDNNLKFIKLDNLSKLLINQDNGVARTGARAFAAESAFDGHVGIQLLKHHTLGTNFHTDPAPGTVIRIHKENAIFKLYGIFRTVVGTHPALVA
jgi:hypothetical protein